MMMAVCLQDVAKKKVSQSFMIEQQEYLYLYVHVG